jgi:hypothetical protein
MVLVLNEKLSFMVDLFSFSMHGQGFKMQQSQKEASQRKIIVTERESSFSRRLADQNHQRYGGKIQSLSRNGIMD